MPKTCHDIVQSREKQQVTHLFFGGVGRAGNSAAKLLLLKITASLRTETPWELAPGSARGHGSYFASRDPWPTG